MSKLELKIPPVAIFLLFAAVMWVAAATTEDYRFNGLFRSILIALTLFVSAVFGLAGIISFKRASTTVHPLKPERSSSLVTSGIFRLSRNPMYLALLLALLAWGLYLSNLYAVAIASLFVPWMNQFQIRPEERAMEKLFAQEFNDYREATRRWL